MGAQPQAASETNALVDDRQSAKRSGFTVGAAATALASLIGAISGITTTLLVLRPNLGTSTENHAEIRRLEIEPDVTLAEYFQHFPVQQSLDQIEKKYPKAPSQLFEAEHSRLKIHGTVIHFEVELKGLRGVEIQPRWSLFDGDTGRRLSDSEKIEDPLPLVLNIEKKAADSGTWEMWVDTSSLTATTFVLRLELYDERNGGRITFSDTQKFRAPTS